MKKQKITTGNNNATNNFVVRIWSKHYYKEETQKFTTRYSGMVTETKTKEAIKFHSAGQLLKAIEDLNKKVEKHRRANNTKQVREK
jgi:hypothetical protein